MTKDGWRGGSLGSVVRIRVKYYDYGWLERGRECLLSLGKLGKWTRNDNCNVANGWSKHFGWDCRQSSI